MFEEEIEKLIIHRKKVFYLYIFKMLKFKENI